MAMDYARLVHKLALIIRKRISPLIAIYWFGSTRGGCANRESDIDLAILGEKTISFPVLRRLKYALEGSSLLPVDLLDLRAVPTVVQFEILQECTVVFCRDQKKRDQFEEIVWCLYLRLADLRRPFLEDQRKRYAR